MQLRLYLLVFVLFIFPSLAMAQESNAGIVQGLWYDREDFFTGETVRVYVAVRNNTGADLSGTVEFFVNGERVERNNIDALDGRIIESWGDWTPDYGTSTISATLSRTEISSTASGTQSVVVTSALAEDTIFIDRDTDNDGTGDLIDQDDDGDGIADSDDAEPLVFNEPAETAEDTEEDENEIETEAANARISAPSETDSQSAGLEQFLTPSRADSALASLTKTITESKRQLDSYRAERSSDNDEAGAEETPSVSSASTTGTVTPEGFGTVTRTQDTEAAQSGWLDTIWQFIAATFSIIYTVILAGLSWLLGHASLVQLLLLFLLLYALYKTAKKFGSRPS